MEWVLWGCVLLKPGVRCGGGVLLMPGVRCGGGVLLCAVCGPWNAGGMRKGRERDAALALLMLEGAWLWRGACAVRGSCVLACAPCVAWNAGGTWKGRERDVLLRLEGAWLGWGACVG